jgi:hypothetical protein
MVATDARGRGQARRFVTRTHVEDAAAAGQTLRLRPRDVITDEAAQRAADLGVRIEREGQPARAGAGAAAPVPPSTKAPAVSREALHRAVHAAVVAELGNEPPGLDAAINTVLDRRLPPG